MIYIDYYNNSIVYLASELVVGTSLNDVMCSECLFLLFLLRCRPKKNLNSKKYGVGLINYTHAQNTAIHSSTKVDGK